MRILLLENHVTFATTVIATILHDHDVVHVTTVAEALRALAHAAFDVALVDYDLDDEKGSNFVRHLREAGNRLAVLNVTPKRQACLLSELTRVVGRVSTSLRNGKHAYCSSSRAWSGGSRRHSETVSMLTVRAHVRGREGLDVTPKR